MTKNKNKYIEAGVFNKQEKLASFHSVGLSSSTIKSYLTEKKDDKGKSSYHTFAKHFIKNKFRLENIKRYPYYRQKVFNDFGWVGEVNEHEIIAKLKETKEFKNIKTDKNRVMSTTWQIHGTSFFNTEIDAYLGKDIQNIKALIEVKISKKTLLETIKQYKTQFNALMYFFNVDTLYLAHYHNKINGKLSVVKIIKNERTIERIIKSLIKIQEIGNEMKPPIKRTKPIRKPLTNRANVKGVGQEIREIDIKDIKISL